jgi:glycerophosphoryl diester phosphodiesterase
MTLDHVRLIAHRGNSAALPENSLAAFRSAWRLGAHMIELDVHLSRDGFPVVIHDDTVDRTTTGSGPVASLRLSQLQRLGIPALEDVLDLPIPLCIELKTAAAMQAVVELVGRREDVILSSTDWDALDFLRQLDPRRRVGYLASADRASAGVERALAGGGAYALQPEWGAVTDELVARCRAAGLRVMSYTVNEPELGRRLFEMGVDAIFTDDPGRMLAIL